VNLCAVLNVDINSTVSCMTCWRSVNDCSLMLS